MNERSTKEQSRYICIGMCNINGLAYRKSMEVKKMNQEINQFELMNETFKHFDLDIEEFKKERRCFDFGICETADAKEITGDMARFGLKQSQRIIIDFDPEYDKVLVRREDMKYGTSKDAPQKY